MKNVSLLSITLQFKVPTKLSYSLYYYYWGEGALRIDPKASCMLGNCSITGDELHPQAQKVKLAFTKLHVPSIIFTLQVQAPLTLTKKKKQKKTLKCRHIPNL